MRKRLFSANERDKIENHIHNTSVLNSKTNQYTEAREKGISPQLPPLGQFLNHNMNNIIESGIVYNVTFYSGYGAPARTENSQLKSQKPTINSKKARSLIKKKK